MNDFTFESSNTFYIESPETPLSSPNRSNGFALASMLMGLGAIVCSCLCCVLYPVSIVLSILSIVFSCIAKKKNGNRMPGKAKAGLILSAFAILAFMIVLCLEIYIAGLSDQELAKLFESIFGIRLEDFIAEYEKNFGAPFHYGAT